MASWTEKALRIAKAASTFRLNSPDAKPVRHKSFTDYCVSVKNKENKRLEEVYGSRWEAVEERPGQDFSLGSVQKAALSETQGLTGGYLVPMDYTLRLMEVVIEESFLYPLATILPMQSQTTQAPKIDIETAQAAKTAPYFGGMLMQWGAEQAPSETEPTFRNVPLYAWDLLGYSKLSNQLFQDIGDAGEEYLINLIAKAASWYTEFAFLQGLGASNSMPLGVINAPAAIQVTSKDNSGNTIVIDDISAMTSDLLPYSWKNAIWACHPTVLNTLQKNITTYFINIEIGRERHGSQCGMLSTRPLFVTDKLPAIGTSNAAKVSGCLVLFDPTLYIIGDRQQILIDISEHNLFQTYQTVLRAWVRMDGKPIVTNKVTAADGTSLVSPYVVLKA
jgi:HK97 family phage major capsid protein